MLTVVLLSLLATLGSAAYCHGKPDPNAKPNANPIYTTKPTLLRSSKHGFLYEAGPADNQFWLMHVYGTPYEWGQAQGELLGDVLPRELDEIWAYIESQAENAVNNSDYSWIPKDVVDWIAKVGIDVALDLTYDATVAYTEKYYFEEMHGIADALGQPERYRDIRRIHMIGELTKGACSMFGAWGDATAGAHMLQLRALDWDMSGPWRKYPMVTVYHPPTGSPYNSFATLGFAGWIGGLTGASSARMGISEIGVSYPDASFGKESRIGVPFTFLLRDILQRDASLADSVARISGAHRTCDLILGVGDGKGSAAAGAEQSFFRGVQYSHSVANFITEDNWAPANDTWHPKVDSMVYFGMDWLCPNYSVVLAKQLEALHGKLTPELTLSHVVPIVQTGDVHLAVYDLTESLMWVGIASRPDAPGPDKAYDRTFTRLDLTAEFARPGPQ